MLVGPFRLCPLTFRYPSTTQIITTRYRLAIKEKPFLSDFFPFSPSTHFPVIHFFVGTYTIVTSVPMLSRATYAVIVLLSSLAKEFFYYIYTNTFIQTSVQKGQSQLVVYIQSFIYFFYRIRWLFGV